VPLSRDRKLDVLGVILAIGIVLGVGLGVFAALEGAQGGGEPTPELNVSAERVNDTHVRLVHAGGDTVRGEDLVITVNNRERGQETFPTSYAEGDSTVVRAAAERTITVYWTGGRGPRESLDSVQV
jgi:hypothetical protein